MWLRMILVASSRPRMGIPVSTSKAILLTLPLEALEVVTR